MEKIKKGELTKDQEAIIKIWFPYLLEEDEEEERKRDS